MNIVTKIISISHKMRSLETIFYASHNLMKYEFNTLAVILNVLVEKENICAKDIAKVNGMSLSAVSRLLNNMEQKNLISRNIDKADRRNVIVHISDDGKKIFNEFASMMDNFLEKIFSQLTDTERPLYNELSNKLIDATETELTAALNKFTEANND